MRKFYFFMICIDLFFIGYCLYYFLSAVSEVSAFGFVLYAIHGTIWVMFYTQDYKRWRQLQKK